MAKDIQLEDIHLRRVENVREYIRCNLCEPLDRELLAEVAGYSIPHFHRIFTAVHGESAVSYVRRLRLIRAGQKLRMGAVDIVAVAVSAGYESHTAFTKAFKKQFGLCPSAFRNLPCFEATKLLREIQK
ncbi:MAG: AraC family transcriptional regulator [Chloroflexota bacterium]